MTITEADHARMTWHARQQLNDRLRAETRTLTAEVARLRHDRAAAARARVRARGVAAAKAAAAKAAAAKVVAEATRILASLPVDPDGIAHRLASLREIYQRKAA